MDPDRIVLFGSRARGDYQSRSDFDLAFFGVRDRRAWVRYANDMAYEPPTLYGLDVMRYDDVHPEMQASILRDGKTIYERVQANPV